MYMYHAVSAIVQRHINISLANRIASSGRPISIVEDNGLQQEYYEQRLKMRILNTLPAHY